MTEQAAEPARPPTPVGIRRSEGDAWLQADIAADRGSTVTLTTSGGLHAQVEVRSELAKRHGWNDTHARTVLATLLTGGPVLLITAPDGRWAGRVRVQTVVFTLFNGVVPRRSHTDPAQRPGPYLAPARIRGEPPAPGVLMLPPGRSSSSRDEGATTPKILDPLITAIVERTKDSPFTTTPRSGPAGLAGVRLTTTGADPRHVDLYALHAAPEQEVLVWVPDLDLWVRYPRLHGRWFRAPEAVAALLAGAETVGHHKDGSTSIQFGPTLI